MSSLRATGASAARLMRSAVQARHAVVPATVRYESSTATTPATVSSQEAQQKKKELAPAPTLPRNAPDYNAPIDMATRSVSGFHHHHTSIYLSSQR